jgi:hypothetical protein
MSRNGFNECEREYNRKEEAIEVAKDQREPAEDSHLSGQADRPETPTLRSQQEVSAQSGSRAQFLLRQARLCIDPFENPDMAEEIDDYLKGDKYERELAALQNAFEDAMTAREQAEAALVPAMEIASFNAEDSLKWRTMFQNERDHHQAANDLLRECRAMLDGLEAQPLIYRIDKAMGEKK